MSHRSFLRFQVHVFAFAGCTTICGKGFQFRNDLLSFALGNQLPRIVRVVWAWPDSCALVAGQRISSPIREEHVDQLRRAPADAQTSQSPDVWVESDFKEACSKLAQLRPRRAERSASARTSGTDPIASACSGLSSGQDSRWVGRRLTHTTACMPLR